MKERRALGPLRSASRRNALGRRRRSPAPPSGPPAGSSFHRLWRQALRFALQRQPGSARGRLARPACLPRSPARPPDRTPQQSGSAAACERSVAGGDPPRTQAHTHKHTYTQTSPPPRDMYSGNSSKRGSSSSSLEPTRGEPPGGQAGEEAAAAAGAPPFSAGTYELLALLIATIGLLGLCNNLLVLVLYARFKRLRTPTHLFLVNISLSDLLVSLFGVTFTFCSCLQRHWVWDAAGCAWDGFSNSLFGIVSIMTLTVLAYERYIRVVHARVIDFSWSWRAITYIWLYSLAWTGAPLLGWNHYALEIHGLGCSVDWRSREPNDSSFILFFFLGCLAAPVGIMAYCYGHILYAVRMLHGVEDLHTIQVIKILRYEKKVAKMCFLMITTFLVCWMPYAVVSLLVAYGYGHLITPTVAIVPSFFAKSSTAYNPVIYIFMNRKFRRCLMQLLCVRVLRLRRSLKKRPAEDNHKPIRPIVMSQKAGDRPKKKVTFSSSSVIFIITSDDSQQMEDSTKHIGTKINVIQVKPL